ncbi:hypothetical protein [Halostagnicola bangensis]
MSGDRKKPDWWRANERARASMDLPSYEPPRFDDSVYVHEVVPTLELVHDCEILFLGINVEYTDEWTVQIDGDDAFSVERSRDDSGNTIYHIDSAAFRSAVERATGEIGATD